MSPTVMMFCRGYDWQKKKRNPKPGGNKRKPGGNKKEPWKQQNMEATKQNFRDEALKNLENIGNFEEY